MLHLRLSATHRLSDNAPVARRLDFTAAKIAELAREIDFSEPPVDEKTPPPFSAPAALPRAPLKAVHSLIPRDGRTATASKLDEVAGTIIHPHNSAKRPRLLPEHLSKSLRCLERGSFTLGDSPIAFSEIARGDFQVFALIAKEQKQIIPERDNATLGVKFFHDQMKRVDYFRIHERILDQHKGVLACGIPCPAIHNAKAFEAGCGYLLVDYIPCEPGVINPEEVIPLFETAYRKRICLDLKYDNLRRMTPESPLMLVDWGGENDAPDTCDLEFGKMIRNLSSRCPGLIVAIQRSDLLRPLLPFAGVEDLHRSLNAPDVMGE